MIINLFLKRKALPKELIFLAQVLFLKESVRKFDQRNIVST
jgi:hypothetical protein